MDPAAAMATNVPSSLVNWLLSFGNGNSLFIHLSTDQGRVHLYYTWCNLMQCKPLFVVYPILKCTVKYDSPVLTVYEGLKSFYKEDDETLPVNMYGKSKVAAEKFIVEKCSSYAILRSSIIYGPQTISPVTKSLPIQVR